MKISSAIVVSLILVGNTQVTFGAVVQFDSKQQYLANAGSIQTETFNGFNSDISFQTAEIDIGAFHLKGFGTQQQVFNYVDAGTPIITGFSLNGTTQVTALTSSPDTGFSILFQSPVSSFGADFLSLQAPGNLLRTYIVAAGETLTPPLHATNTITFFGFTSSTPFTEVRFVSANNPSVLDSFAMDNASFTPTVPEPSSSLLLVAGLAYLRSRASRS